MRQVFDRRPRAGAAAHPFGLKRSDFMKPDRVVVGVETDRAKQVMGEIYRPMFLRDFPIIYTDLESAELIKYAANAFLATKISFINEIAALCERVGADVKSVAKGMPFFRKLSLQKIHNRQKISFCQHVRR